MDEIKSNLGGSHSMFEEKFKVFNTNIPAEMLDQKNVVKSAMILSAEQDNENKDNGNFSILMTDSSNIARTIISNYVVSGSGKVSLQKAYDELKNSINGTNSSLSTSFSALKRTFNSADAMNTATGSFVFGTASAAISDIVSGYDGVGIQLEGMNDRIQILGVGVDHSLLYRENDNTLNSPMSAESWTPWHTLIDDYHNQNISGVKTFTATGTPFKVNSTTMVSNLNVEYIQGQRRLVQVYGRNETTSINSYENSYPNAQVILAVKLCTIHFAKYVPTDSEEEGIHIAADSKTGLWNNMPLTFDLKGRSSKGISHIAVKFSNARFYNDYDNTPGITVESFTCDGDQTYTNRLYIKKIGDFKFEIWFKPGQRYDLLYISNFVEPNNSTTKVTWNEYDGTTPVEDYATEIPDIENCIICEDFNKVTIDGVSYSLKDAINVLLSKINQA